VNGYFTERLHEIGPGDHICLVYDEQEEQAAAVVPYIKVGLERRERCLYVADDEAIGEASRRLQDAGVDVVGETARGALSLVANRDAYLRFGQFNPDEMVTFLGQSTERTRADGFAALRITGEMTWALGSEVGCDRLIEYEVSLNRFFPGSHALAVCQYHRQRFSPAIIRDVLRTHPLAILGSLICSNAYYEPPDVIMSGGDDAQRVEWMIRQLKTSREAEERLIHQAEQLARSNAGLEQFAYVASHDLREPLRMMSTYSQLLARKYGGRLDAEAEQIMGYIVDGASRIESLVSGLSAYSSVTAPDESGRSGRVDMNRAAGVAILNLTALIRETGARVTQDDLPAVRGDETQLVQVVQNLIDNAIKFRKMDEAPCVHLTGRRAGEDAVFSVRDNGIGIPTLYQAQIFGIFKRLSRSGSGTGIGLALCQRIVEKHHGTIWVESEPGKGSQFSFTIPAAK
jgi:signal transduction histidine kinase